MIPPSSIPSAAAGRFTAPEGEWSHQGGPACPQPLPGQGAALWTSQDLGEPIDPTVDQTTGWESHQLPQGEPKVSSKNELSVSSSPAFKKLGNMGSWLPTGGSFLPPSLLTYEEVGLGGGGTVLLLQEFVQEGGQTRNDRGEAALSQHQEDEEGVEQQPEEDLWESYRETTGKMSFSRVILTAAICTGKKPPRLGCSQ